MGPENVEEFALAKEGGPEYEARMAMYGDAFAVATKDNVVEMFGGLLSEPDKAVLEPESAREEFAASMRQGFEFGWRGFYDDDQAIMKEWGFDPTTITVPVSVWFGDQDLMVPRTHGSGWRRVCRRRASASSPETARLVVVNHLDELSAAIKTTYA